MAYVLTEVTHRFDEKKRRLTPDVQAIPKPTPPIPFNCIEEDDSDEVPGTPEFHRFSDPRNRPDKLRAIPRARYSQQSALETFRCFCGKMDNLKERYFLDTEHRRKHCILLCPEHISMDEGKLVILVEEANTFLNERKKLCHWCGQEGSKPVIKCSFCGELAFCDENCKGLFQHIKDIAKHECVIFSSKRKEIFSQ